MENMLRAKKNRVAGVVGAAYTAKLSFGHA